MVAEQLLRPVPGGVGRYVRALASHLPVEAAVDRGAVEFLVARHPPDRLSAVGLPAATCRLAWPGRLVTRTWVTLRRPALASCSTSSTWSTRPAPPCPRRDAGRWSRPSTTSPGTDAYPAAGRRYERSARIVADEAARVLVLRGHRPRPGRAVRRRPGRVTITPLGVEVPLSRTGPGPSGSCATWASASFLLRRHPGAAQESAPAAGRLRPGGRRAARPLAGGGGPGRLKPRLRPTWDSVRVKLAGQVGDALLHALYQAADGLAYPSLYEGFGLPVLEAMANGIPVLTSDRSSLPEALGGAALLVDPGLVGHRRRPGPPGRRRRPAPAPGRGRPPRRRLHLAGHRRRHRRLPRGRAERAR